MNHMSNKKQRSLDEINNTVDSSSNKGASQKFLVFLGLGLLAVVGHMDPGNWITFMQGGAQFGYILLFIILVSSLAATFLQSMTVRLDIATEMDLAQMTRHYLDRPLAIISWIIVELAIIATDIAEIIGSAIALDLLFNIPLTIGALITVLDVFLLLFVTKFGFRKIEAIVGTLIFTVLIIFLFEVFISSPKVINILNGFIPRKGITVNHNVLCIALRIIGATIMPHNLYLYSSIVQSHKYDRTNENDKTQVVKYATIDSNIQLSIASIVNCLLLILGAALFYGVNADKLGEFYDLYHALKTQPLLGSVFGSIMSTLFAIALLASGQNSTITGTLSGRIVMEGFLRLSIPNWLGRLITRGLVVTSVIICLIVFKGNESKMEQLLVLPQVFSSIALPLSLILLQLATSNKKLMGPSYNKNWINFCSWSLVTILSLLNVYLTIETFKEFFV